MQFHLDGYRPGDPRVAEAQEDPSGTGPLPEEVDVLIVGCGPAGLTLAAQLAAFPSITTRIVEQREGPLARGRADGIAVRTMEMFEAFAFSEHVLREAYWVNETTFWRPDEADPTSIVRGGQVQDVEDGLSEFPHVILNQARVHDHYRRVMHDAPTRLTPDYGRRLVDLRVADPAAAPDATSAGHATHPVTARLEQVGSEHGGAVRTVRARYVVGCDGARSTVREQLGLTLRGDSANQAWGVMDVLAVTDFPDIRLKSTIHSASEGNLLVIPREGGYLVRLYVELDELDEDERVRSRDITVGHLVAAAQRILQPYTLEVEEVAWWSVYEIGQRLCDRFDDVPETAVGTRRPQVFIAGDACHTHSPKAGQGMNVSMRDAFNLGWKLAAVLLGRADPALLDTYSAERHAVARELIDFDREFAAMFSATPRPAVAAAGDDTAEDAAAADDGAPDDAADDGVDPAAFQEYFVRKARFTAGVATRYGPSLITGEGTDQHLAEGLTIGMRFHSAPAVRLADARPVHLGHVLEADGRWRLVAFAGADGLADSSRLRALCEFLVGDPDSPVRRHTPPGEDVDAVIDVRAVVQQGHRELELDRLPRLLLPRKGRLGLIDYEKTFCPDPRRGDVFDLRGIDRGRGCVVVVRPDQHVAHVLPLDAHLGLTAFFARFLLVAC